MNMSYEDYIHVFSGFLKKLSSFIFRIEIRFSFTDKIVRRDLTSLNTTKLLGINLLDIPFNDFLFSDSHNIAKTD